MNTTYRYGLACISEILRDNEGLAFKTITRSNFNKVGREKGLQTLSSRILHNVKLISRVIKHCHQLGISHYRVSDMLPLLSDKTLGICFQDLPDIIEITDAAKVIGNTSKELKITTSSHPGQFTMLASKKDNVIESSIKDLVVLDEFLNMCGLPQDKRHPVNIHPGRSATCHEDAKDIAETYYNNLRKLPESMQTRLVLENDDKGFWSCERMYMYFHKHLVNKFGWGFSLTYDNLHDQCLPSLGSQEYWIETFKSTWNGFTPVMHWSEGGKDGNPRAHVDYITIGKPPTTDCIWEIEVKAKDKAILKLLES